MEKSKAASRMVTRGFGSAFEEAAKFSSSAEGKRLAFLRHTVLEGLFGEAKTFHGMSRAKMRGLDKVEIQLLLTAIALNLKRPVKSCPVASGCAHSILCFLRHEAFSIYHLAIFNF